MKLIKTIALTLMTALILTSSSSPKDKDDHTLVALWKEYYAAESADKPKTQESVLEKIKTEAKAKHLTWDFYDAAVKLSQVRISANWKLRDSENSARDKDIEEFGEPVAVFFLKNNYYGWSDTDKGTFIDNNKSKLEKVHNPEFYSHDWRITGKIYGSLLPGLFANDYEYCIWSLGEAGRMEKTFKDYPLSAFAEYESIALHNNYPEENVRVEKLRAFQDKWNGKAVALLAEQQLLSITFSDLCRYENGQLKGKSADFEALRDKCLAFEKKRATFKGDEKKIADCCTMAKDELEILNQKSISAEVKDSKLTISLRNMEAVTARVLKGKDKIWEKYITNPYKSYYTEDKLLLELPDLEDGTYDVKCFYGDISDDVRWQKYTISASARANASGVGIWAVDYISGEPLKKVDVELLKDDKVEQSATLTLDGFTPLPSSWASKINQKRSEYSLRVKSGRRSSRNISLSTFKEVDNTDSPERLNAVIITDRGAYNPDETLHFKAVIYKGKYSIKTVGSGKAITIELRDPQGKSIESKTLKTNEFGSVAGDFMLKRGGRNGMYQLVVMSGSDVLIRHLVRVDDFVLPTFDLVFDKESTFYHPVSEIRTGGSVYAYSGHSLTASTVKYSVQHGGEEWASGILHPDRDGRFDITFATDSTKAGSYYDWYYLKVTVTDASGETMEWNKSFTIRPKPTPRAETEYYFKDDEEAYRHGGMSVKVVAGDKPVWMAVEAHGPEGKLVWKRMVQFAPAMTKEPATTTVEYKLKDSDPEAMSVTMIYFQDKRTFSHTTALRKEDHRYDLPLTFSRFLDTTVPGTGYTFGIKTLAGVECAASIFDKSTERYESNRWSLIRTSHISCSYIPYGTANGIDASYSNVIYVRGLTSKMSMSKAAVNMAMADAAVPESAEAEEAIPFQLVEEKPQPTPDIPIRENFANTIAWEPFLRSDKDGNISFSFTNADKLSTYYVQLFAHDKKMRNEVVRREMVVTIPVKISLVEPQFLYEGDKYNVRVALSSSISKELKGKLSVQMLDGTDHKTAPVLRTASCEITVPAKGGVNQDFVLEAPAVKDLGLKIVFVPESGTYGSDGVFVSVPVKKPVQTLTEAHSAVLLSGDDKVALEASLRAMFENIDGSVPVLEEIDIRQMLYDALPSELKPNCDNAISLARALYAWSLCQKLGLEPEFDREDAIKKLLACKNADGGFGWFAGMPSSCMVTAVVLRLVHGLSIVDEAAAVHYLDARFFAKEKSGWWYRGLSLEQYLHTRSFFPGVSFEQKTDDEFRKEAREYLVPKKARGLNGWIAAKARRVQTLDNLLTLEGGVSLASKMGVKLGTASKLRKSLAADIESLVEYAQPHKCGGMYYPNAVMPWRGLLESELDAHCALIAIMGRFGHSDISDSIRLWIMIQKETQSWKQQSGYIEALGAVLNGPESVLDTKVLALKADYTAPFESIKAAGNGMTIAADIRPDVSKIGDKIKLSYTITNEENRSFVKVTIPFGAGLIPVNQLSGYRWGYYRNVLADRIELWYEVYPEEKTTVSEEFYVTRAGSFQAPVATIECEYAPHYRANDGWNGRLEISAE
ncbi:MAG: hypothetical protein IKX45_06540 [Bacteroidales bacterium]|nr:hypothetical protein [Bacteroidales bacterium]